jgi:hypothetical protein
VTTSDHHFVVRWWSERGLKCPELTALDVAPAGLAPAMSTPDAVSAIAAVMTRILRRSSSHPTATRC